MKKVLVITYYWPPSGGPGVQRVLKFCKYLPEFGWEPIVLTVAKGDFPITDDSHTHEIQNVKVFKQSFFEPHNIYKKLLGMGVEEAITTTVLTDEKVGLTNRLAKWIRLNCFVPDARVAWLFSGKKALKNSIGEESPHLIFSTGPPHTVHLLARKWSKILGVPYITDLRDPWTEFVSYQGNPRFFLSRIIDQYLERKTLTAAKKITVVSPTMKKMFCTFLPEEKIEVITNGFDSADFSGTVEKEVPEFIWTYNGNLDKNRVPRAFLYAVKKFTQQEIGSIKCRFVGRQCPELLAEIQSLEIEDICSFEGYVSHNQALEFLQASYGTLLVIDNVSNNECFIPGKVFEYIGTDKPVIGIGPTNGDSTKVLSDSGAGKMFDYQDSDGIFDFLILHFKNFNEGMRHATDKGKYERKTLTFALSEIFDSMV
ncbi:MAG: glycosyltransferase [Candidatus Marinimicrobia bacterium]|nr:glycosyltransferase [Candidatus Neomarinimicrobiota bacterium]MBT4069403.1 glycosyltransferase [Candidatus Neomarinimicrobiota bacterium]MBT4177641.1 glycosyltransferase [Candidatus Neomarinimicrobiota bacterium]MBT6930506.1 glycosyltransferase [Candidatus Neomarinimicrobiota bacterium]MBT7985775.1 glycosyltransferase [Candidatus Neomarinimicrobiota bacterium]